MHDRRDASGESVLPSATRKRVPDTKSAARPRSTSSLTQQCPPTANETGISIGAAANLFAEQRLDGAI